MKTQRCNKSLISKFVISLFLASASWAGQDRYVVAGDDLADLANAVDQLGGKIHGNLKYHKAFTATLSDESVEIIRGFYGKKAFLEKDGVASVRPDFDTKASAPPAPPQPSQVTHWGVSFIDSRPAWEFSRGAGVKVGVLDTGIQKNHPDLVANIVGGASMISTKWDDDNGHGTHVAGVIAAIDNSIGIVGVAPLAKLFVVKVLDRNGNGNTSLIADGVRSCIANGAQVINMSFESSTDSTLLRNAITDAYNAGIILVAAAGNSGLPDVAYPAKYPEVLAISALYLISPTNRTFNITGYSNYGPKIAFAAPGHQTYSTWKGSAYATLSGTSQAAPHVSGVVALMISSGGSSWEDLGFKDIGLTPDEQGWGMINALNTVSPPAP